MAKRVRDQGRRLLPSDSSLDDSVRQCKLSEKWWENLNDSNTNSSPYVRRPDIKGLSSRESIELRHSRNSSSLLGPQPTDGSGFSCGSVSVESTHISTIFQRRKAVVSPSKYNAALSNETTYAFNRSGGRNLDPNNSSFHIDMQESDYSVHDSREIFNALRYHRNNRKSNHANKFGSVLSEITHIASNSVVENIENNSSLSGVSHAIYKSGKYEAPAISTYCRQTTEENQTKTTYVTISEVKERVYYQNRSCRVLGKKADEFSEALSDVSCESDGLLVQHVVSPQSQRKSKPHMIEIDSTSPRLQICSQSDLDDDLENCDDMEDILNRSGPVKNFPSSRNKKKDKSLLISSSEFANVLSDDIPTSRGKGSLNDSAERSEDSRQESRESLTGHKVPRRRSSYTKENKVTSKQEDEDSLYCSSKNRVSDENTLSSYGASFSHNSYEDISYVPQFLTKRKKGNSEKILPVNPVAFDEVLDVDSTSEIQGGSRVEVSQNTSDVEDDLNRSGPVEEKLFRSSRNRKKNKSLLISSDEFANVLSDDIATSSDKGSLNSSLGYRQNSRQARCESSRRETLNTDQNKMSPNEGDRKSSHRSSQKRMSDSHSFCSNGLSSSHNISDVPQLRTKSKKRGSKESLPMNPVVFDEVLNMDSTSEIQGGNIVDVSHNASDIEDDLNRSGPVEEKLFRSSRNRKKNKSLLISSDEFANVLSDDIATSSDKGSLNSSSEYRPNSRQARLESSTRETLNPDQNKMSPNEGDRKLSHRSSQKRMSDSHSFCSNGLSSSHNISDVPQLRTKSKKRGSKESLPMNPVVFDEVLDVDSTSEIQGGSIVDVSHNASDIEDDLNRSGPVEEKLFQSSRNRKKNKSLIISSDEFANVLSDDIATSSDKGSLNSSLGYRRNSRLARLESSKRETLNPDQNKMSPNEGDRKLSHRSSQKRMSDSHSFCSNGLSSSHNISDVPQLRTKSKKRGSKESLPMNPVVFDEVLDVDSTSEIQGGSIVDVSHNASDIEDDLNRSGPVEEKLFRSSRNRKKNKSLLISSDEFANVLSDDIATSSDKGSLNSSLGYRRNSRQARLESSTRETLNPDQNKMSPNEGDRKLSHRSSQKRMSDSHSFCSNGLSSPHNISDVPQLRTKSKKRGSKESLPMNPVVFDEVLDVDSTSEIQGVNIVEVSQNTSDVEDDLNRSGPVEEKLFRSSRNRKKNKSLLISSDEFANVLSDDIATSSDKGSLNSSSEYRPNSRQARLESSTRETLNPDQNKTSPKEGDRKSSHRSSQKRMSDSHSFCSNGLPSPHNISDVPQLRTKSKKRDSKETLPLNPVVFDEVLNMNSTSEIQGGNIVDVSHNASDIEDDLNRSGPVEEKLFRSSRNRKKNKSLLISSGEFANVLSDEIAASSDKGSLNSSSEYRPNSRQARLESSTRETLNPDQNKMSPNEGDRKSSHRSSQKRMSDSHSFSSDGVYLLCDDNDIPGSPKFHAKRRKGSSKEIFSMNDYFFKSDHMHANSETNLDLNNHRNKACLGSFSGEKHSDQQRKGNATVNCDSLPECRKTFVENEKLQIPFGPQFEVNGSNTAEIVLSLRHSVFDVESASALYPENIDGTGSSNKVESNPNLEGNASGISAAQQEMGGNISDVCKDINRPDKNGSKGNESIMICRAEKCLNSNNRSLQKVLPAGDIGIKNNTTPKNIRELEKTPLVSIANSDVVALKSYQASHVLSVKTVSNKSSDMLLDQRNLYQDDVMSCIDEVSRYQDRNSGCGGPITTIAVGNESILPVHRKKIGKDVPPSVHQSIFDNALDSATEMSSTTLNPASRTQDDKGGLAEGNKESSHQDRTSGCGGLSTTIAVGNESILPVLRKKIGKAVPPSVHQSIFDNALDSATEISSTTLNPGSRTQDDKGGLAEGNNELLHSGHIEGDLITSSSGREAVIKGDSMGEKNRSMGSMQNNNMSSGDVATTNQKKEHSVKNRSLENGKEKIGVGGSDRTSGCGGPSTTIEVGNESILPVLRKKIGGEVPSSVHQSIFDNALDSATEMSSTTLNPASRTQDDKGGLAEGNKESSHQDRTSGCGGLSTIIAVGNESILPVLRKKIGKAVPPSVHQSIFDNALDSATEISSTTLNPGSRTQDDKGGLAEGNNELLHSGHIESDVITSSSGREAVIKGESTGEKNRSMGSMQNNIMSSGDVATTNQKKEHSVKNRSLENGKEKIGVGGSDGNSGCGGPSTTIAVGNESILPVLHKKIGKAVPPSVHQSIFDNALDSATEMSSATLNPCSRTQDVKGGLAEGNNELLHSGHIQGDVIISSPGREEVIKGESMGEKNRSMGSMQNNIMSSGDAVKSGQMKEHSVKNRSLENGKEKIEVGGSDRTSGCGGPSTTIGVGNESILPVLRKKIGGEVPSSVHQNIFDNALDSATEMSSTTLNPASRTQDDKGGLAEGNKESSHQDRTSGCGGLSTTIAVGNESILPVLRKKIGKAVPPSVHQSIFDNALDSATEMSSTTLNPGSRTQDDKGGLAEGNNELLHSGHIKGDVITSSPGREAVIKGEFTGEKNRSMGSMQNNNMSSGDVSTTNQKKEHSVKKRSLENGKEKIGVGGSDGNSGCGGPSTTIGFGNESILPVLRKKIGKEVPASIHQSIFDNALDSATEKSSTTSNPASRIQDDNIVLAEVKKELISSHQDRTSGFGGLSTTIAVGNESILPVLRKKIGNAVPPSVHQSIFDNALDSATEMSSATLNPGSRTQDDKGGLADGNNELLHSGHIEGDVITSSSGREEVIKGESMGEKNRSMGLMQNNIMSSGDAVKSGQKKEHSVKNLSLENGKEKIVVRGSDRTSGCGGLSTNIEVGNESILPVLRKRIGKEVPASVHQSIFDNALDSATSTSSTSVSPSSEIPGEKIVLSSENVSTNACEGLADVPIACHKSEPLNVKSPSIGKAVQPLTMGGQILNKSPKGYISENDALDKMNHSHVGQTCSNEVIVEKTVEKRTKISNLPGPSLNQKSFLEDLEDDSLLENFNFKQFQRPSGYFESTRRFVGSMDPKSPHFQMWKNFSDLSSIIKEPVLDGDSSPGEDVNVSMPQKDNSVSLSCGKGSAVFRNEIEGVRHKSHLSLSAGPSVPFSHGKSATGYSSIEKEQLVRSGLCPGKLERIGDNLAPNLSIDMAPVSPISLGDLGNSLTIEPPPQTEHLNVESIRGQDNSTFDKMADECSSGEPMQLGEGNASGVFKQSGPKIPTLVPEEVNNLTFVKSFAQSFNRLSPSIPEGGINNLTFVKTMDDPCPPLSSLHMEREINNLTFVKSTVSHGLSSPGQDIGNETAEQFFNNLTFVKSFNESCKRSSNAVSEDLKSKSFTDIKPLPLKSVSLTEAEELAAKSPILCNAVTREATTEAEILIVNPVKHACQSDTSTSGVVNTVAVKDVQISDPVNCSRKLEEHFSQEGIPSVIPTTATSSMQPSSEIQIGEHFSQEGIPSVIPSTATSSMQPSSEIQIGEHFRHEGIPSVIPSTATSSMQPSSEIQIGEHFRHEGIPSVIPSTATSSIHPSSETLIGEQVMDYSTESLTVQKSKDGSSVHLGKQLSKSAFSSGVIGPSSKESSELRDGDNTPVEISGPTSFTNQNCQPLNRDQSMKHRFTKDSASSFGMTNPMPTEDSERLNSVYVTDKSTKVYRNEKNNSVSSSVLPSPQSALLKEPLTIQNDVSVKVSRATSLLNTFQTQNGEQSLAHSCMRRLDSSSRSVQSIACASGPINNRGNCESIQFLRNVFTEDDLLALRALETPPRYKVDMENIWERLFPVPRQAPHLNQSQKIRGGDNLAEISSVNQSVASGKAFISVASTSVPGSSSDMQESNEVSSTQVNDESGELVKNQVTKDSNSSGDASDEEDAEITRTVNRVLGKLDEWFAQKRKQDLERARVDLQRFHSLFPPVSSQIPKGTQNPKGQKLICCARGQQPKAIEKNKVKKNVEKRRSLPAWCKKKAFNTLMIGALEEKEVPFLDQENFLQDFADLVTQVMKSKDPEVVKSGVQTVMKKLFDLEIIRCQSDYYTFVRNHMPYEFRCRSIPCLGWDDPIYAKWMDEADLEKTLFPS